MALGRNHRIFNIGNSSGSYGISRVYHDSTLSGDGTLSSLLGVVDAGDTEVNEFVYNNSGDIIDVNNVVQSNSGEWGNGGESYSALTSNSANWNEVSSKLDASAFDPNEFYPMTGNPSGFLTAVDLSDVVLNSAINYYRPEYGVSGISGRELYAISSKYAALDEHGHGLIEPYNYINNNSARIGDVVLNYEQTSASYVVVNNNSANWNDISAYQQNSANYLTAHQSLDGYATTAWVEEQGYLTAHQDISNKLDASAFSDVSGTFLTAVPAGYATTGEVNSVSSILSAAIDAQSGNVYTGIDPIVVNNDDKAISANTWAFSAGDGVSFVDDNVNKITRIDVTAQGGNAEVESYVQTNSGSIDETVSTVETNSASWGAGSTPTYEYTDNNLISAIDTSGLFAQGLLSGSNIGRNIVWNGGMGLANSYQMWLNPDRTHFAITSGIFSPLYYATGATITYGSSGSPAPQNGQIYGGFFKGNEWYVSNATAGQALRGETHASRGVHLSGATTAGRFFDLSTNGVRGLNSIGTWLYGPAEDRALRTVSALEYNAVDEISGIAGSAIAQYGAEKQWLVHDDTLVHAANSAQYALGVNLSAVAQLLGIDETVLFSGTPTSAATLSESMENFDYLRLYFNLGAIDRPNPVITCRYSPVMTVSWAQGVANAFQTIAYISANPTAMKVIHSRQVALGSFTSTAAANTTGTLDSTNALNTITKVVGVHRISEV